jgi:serine/threonine protein kinase
MSVFLDMSSLAVRTVLDAACEAVGFRAGAGTVEGVVTFLRRHFLDQSQKLTVALTRANARAWRALEIALAGDTWWERCKAALVPADERAFRQQVQTFLDARPLPDVAGKLQFRRQCLRELQAARKDGLLTGGPLRPDDLARKAGEFARHADPEALLAAEAQALGTVADLLRLQGHGNLAWLVAQKPEQGPPLLVVAVRYFFRREVEIDRELFQGLAFTRLATLSQSQEQGFAALAEALDRQGQRLEDLLLDVHNLLLDVHDDVLDLKAEVQKQGRQVQDVGRAVLEALEQHRLGRREVRPGDSLSIRGDDERELVKALVARYRALPEDQRRQAPALLNALGTLEVAAGEFDAAQRDFQQVAALVAEPAAQAEAHHNTYQATLERRQWPIALAALRRAAQLDARRFAPFPFDKYEAETILGAGGFGVAFRCRHRNSGSRVVVKALRTDGLGREVADVFAEARALEELDHPAVIRLRDCDFAGPGRTRPFLVMDYFDGPTLAEHVERNGPLSPEDLLPVARAIAEGLRAAHGRGVLHRDVKPGNVLVRREPDGWRIKLIDFGLALTRDAVADTVRTPGQSARTVVGRSVAGTVDYAPPEQFGRLPGVPVGPYSDVYGFGKTCCHALFQTTQPLPRHFRFLTPALARLLEECLEESPDKRPADFAAVLARLRQAVDESIPTLESAESSIRTVLPAEPSRQPAEVLPVEDEVPEVHPVEDEPPARKARKRARREVSVRVVYRGDWFFYDAGVEVFLDGRPLGVGSAVSGFDFHVDTSAGNHQLEVRVLFRSKCYLLQLMKEGHYEVRLFYDRMWGTFADKIEVTHSPL